MSTKSLGNPAFQQCKTTNAKTKPETTRLPDTKDEIMKLRNCEIENHETTRLHKIYTDSNHILMAETEPEEQSCANPCPSKLNGAERRRVC
jgi:hypothetical protein